MVDEYVRAVGKASPPIAVAGVTIAGMSLQEWVLVSTLIYTILQTALLIRKYFKERGAGPSK